MTKDRIKAIQQKIGVVDDGIWGPKSNAACQKHLRSFMPLSNPFPESNQAALRAFYGAPGDESNLINLSVPVGVTVHYEGKPVKTLRCHAKLSKSLTLILARLAVVAPGVLLKYAGCYNNRSVRGGSSPSLHAYGAAIDFAPDTNGNHTHWPTGADMPLEVMEVFAREGWLPAGAFWNRDAMHFQATR